MTAVASPNRTDEQKACRKLVIQQGLRLGQRAGGILIIAVAGVVFGLRSHGTPQLVGFVAGTLALLTSIPFIIMGKRLARQDSRVLAAIDDPRLLAAIHVEGTPRMKDRYAIALRHTDDSADHILLSEPEFVALRTYLSDSRPDLTITQSNNAARTIRLAVS